MEDRNRVGGYHEYKLVSFTIIGIVTVEVLYITIK